MVAKQSWAQFAFNDKAGCPPFSISLALELHLPQSFSQNCFKAKYEQCYWLQWCWVHTGRMQFGKCKSERHN